MMYQTELGFQLIKKLNISGLASIIIEDSAYKVNIMFTLDTTAGTELASF